MSNVTNLYPVGVRVADAGRSDPVYPGAFLSILSVGCYTTSQLQGAGVGDNAISSVELPPTFRIVLFDDDNFAGNSTVISETTFSLWNIGFNDITSSACVQSVYAGGVYPATL